MNVVGQGDGYTGDYKTENTKSHKVRPRPLRRKGKHPPEHSLLRLPTTQRQPGPLSIVLGPLALLTPLLAGDTALTRPPDERASRQHRIWTEVSPSRTGSRETTVFWGLDRDQERRCSLPE